MGYFKNTMYYGPNCIDFSDNSPEAIADQRAPQPTGNYRAVYKKDKAVAKYQYFLTEGEARKAVRRLKESGYLAWFQFWHSKEKLWIG